MAKTRENIQVLLRRIMKMPKESPSVLANPQIDWNSLYQANQNPVIDSNGNIMGYEAAKSHYVLYEDRTDDQTVVASSNFSTQLNENLIMNAGGSLRNLKSHNYQLLLDLLGGAYFEDIDGFMAVIRLNLI
jgi:hypothetical protein